MGIFHPQHKGGRPVSSMGDEVTRRPSVGFAGALINSVFLQGRLSKVLKESTLNSP